MVFFAAEPLSFPVELEWRGWVVCGILIAARLLLMRFPSLLSDVVFSVSGLATAWIGALSSGEIRTSLTNPIGLGLIAFSLIATFFRFPLKELSIERLNASIPWSSFLLVFSAYLFYFACSSSSLSDFIAYWICFKGAFFGGSSYVILFFLSWGIGAFFPSPIGCGILFSAAASWNLVEPFSLTAAAICIACGSVIHTLKRIQIIKRFRKWKLQVGTRFGSY